MTRPTVAVFRPDDERLEAAVTLLEDLDVEPLADPMLQVEPTGRQPRTDADYTILTSKTGADRMGETGWQPAGRLCAIGQTTAEALERAGFRVDIVPKRYSSEGMVDRLDGQVDGACVEVARSDHGSAVLLDGLEAAGAYVHETILYRLTRPADAGTAAVRAAEGTLDAALFTSSLTVENLLDSAAERDILDDVITGLNEGLVGCIGPPTARTAREHGIEVAVVADTADFEVLAREVSAAL